VHQELAFINRPSIEVRRNHRRAAIISPIWYFLQCLPTIGRNRRLVRLQSRGQGFSRGNWHYPLSIDWQIRSAGSAIHPRDAINSVNTLGQ